MAPDKIMEILWKAGARLPVPGRDVELLRKARIKLSEKYNKMKAEYERLHDYVEDL